jgi:hypothetical protein
MLAAANVEDSLMQAGARGGVDYTIMDCYRLAAPFALSMFEKSGEITIATTWPELRGGDQSENRKGQ